MGALALLLTCVALYGTVSWRVSRRIPEIGIRMALGAPRIRVLGSVIHEAVSLVAVGALAGALIARASSPLVAEQLFQVSPTAPDVHVSTAVILLLVGVAAAYGPARRAARMDPMAALRSD